jgi:hypothetical protein
LITKNPYQYPNLRFDVVVKIITEETSPGMTMEEELERQEIYRHHREVQADLVSVTVVTVTVTVETVVVVTPTVTGVGVTDSFDQTHLKTSISRIHP